MLLRELKHIGVVGRRDVLAGLAAVMTLCMSRTAKAEDANTTKGAAWILGDRLSLAALLYNQNAAPDQMNRYLDNAKGVASDLGLSVPPFPAKAADSSEATADLVHYLIAGDGAQIGAALAKKYDSSHGELFEVAVKSNLLILLYGPGDSLGLSIAQVVRDRMQSVGVPERLWSDVVDAVEQHRSADDVKDAVFKMHKDVTDFFIPGAG
jgi:hypothetical protein